MVISFDRLLTRMDAAGLLDKRIKDGMRLNHVDSCLLKIEEETKNKIYTGRTEHFLSLASVTRSQSPLSSLKSSMDL